MRREFLKMTRYMAAAVAVAAVTGCSTAETKPAVTASTTSSTTQSASATSPVSAKPAQTAGIREPNWQYTGGTDTRAHYIDANNITDRNGYRYAWSKWVYRTIKRNYQGKAYSFEINLAAYHCPTTMWALVSYVEYSESGTVVGSSGPVSTLDWHHLVPDSVGAADAAFVCNALPGYVPVAAAQQPAPPARTPVVSKLSPAEVFKKVRDSVWVLISFNLKQGKPDLDNAALGSAVAVGPATLLTNCHTLKGHVYHVITRTDADEPTPVTTVKADFAGDRCIVQAQERLPAYVEIKPYNAVDIGEEAYSIGTPRGYELTMADGIVSAKRNLDGVRYLQTTAPVSPGSSGGGLFDGAGRLIGITTWTRKDSQNLNFAIAADAF